MNRDEIMNMQPGRELDNLVAEKVMGWTDLYGGTGDFLHETGLRLRGNVPYYSSAISAAWVVVEKFSNYRMQKLRDNDHRLFNGKAHQCFFRSNGIVAYGHTAPEAICKAALLSLIQEDTP